jgi:SAM-dependent methyltransferase
MTDDDLLPLPPHQMRMLVGPTDDAAFDNPTGGLVFPYLEPRQYEAVLDFGCGCGRVARQLIQQRPSPTRYLGIDLHRGMIEWCRRNLAPRARGFEFVHHDVFELAFNPNAVVTWRPFPVEDATFSLLLALSVYTHLNQDQAVQYLAETRRVLREAGVAITSWFLFEKREFPMMQEEQNALFINETNWTNAVIFDRDWLLRSVRDAGLSIVRADPPSIRGFQWSLQLAPIERGLAEVELPPDVAPYGTQRAPHCPPHAHRIGLDP